MTKYIFVFALCLSLPAFSNEDGICRDVFQTHGKMKFARQFFTNPDACFLSVNPDYSPDLIYRNFIFRETGKLLVFNSYGPGDQSIMTGARVFYFFPLQHLTYKAAQPISAPVKKMRISFGIRRLDCFREIPNYKS